jgi:hypothetical protein
MQTQMQCQDLEDFCRYFQLRKSSFYSLVYILLTILSFLLQQLLQERSFVSTVVFLLLSPIWTTLDTLPDQPTYQISDC